MSDPTVPQPPAQPEANYIAAAEKAIADLRTEASNAATAALIAKRAADRAVAAAKKFRIKVIVAFILLVATTSVTGYYVNQNRSQSDELRQQAISSCQIGNDRAAGNVYAVDALISVLEGPHPKADIKAIAEKLEANILMHNEPRNCQQAYTPKG